MRSSLSPVVELVRQILMTFEQGHADRQYGPNSADWSPPAAPGARLLDGHY